MRMEQFAPISSRSVWRYVFTRLMPAVTEFCPGTV
jgi:hypothetical protein